MVVTAPKPPPPQTVGMKFMDFTVDVVKVHVGDRLTFTGSASWCYVAECGNEYASA